MYLKLKVELSCREDDYKQKYKGFFMDRNLVVDENNYLPGADKITHIDFTSDYSPAYDHHSKGKVNTRLLYPENSGDKGKYSIYCKLSWRERQLLKHFEHKAIYQKEPIQFYGLVFAFVGTIFGLYKDLFVYPAYIDTKQDKSQTEITTPTERIDSSIQKVDSSKIVPYSATISQNTRHVNALKFINGYVENCNKMKQSVGIIDWVNSNGLSTNGFRTELKRIIDDAYKAEPEVGLDFDPILDAQDFPDKGFEFESVDETTNYLTVRGKDWPDFKLTIKIIEENEKWLVDGCGIINIPTDKRAKR